MSALRDIFYDDDEPTGKPGQLNPVKVFSLPPVIALNVAAVHGAWADTNLAQNLPYYIGAVVGGWALWAGAVVIHSYAKK